MGFSRQEYWSRLPFPPLGDLPDPGIELESSTSPALQEDSLLLSHGGFGMRIFKGHIARLTLIDFFIFKLYYSIISLDNFLAS